MRKCCLTIMYLFVFRKKRRTGICRSSFAFLLQHALVFIMALVAELALIGGELRYVVVIVAF